MCLAQGPQRSEAGEARTRGPSVSSQALYHWATALPNMYHVNYALTSTCNSPSLSLKGTFPSTERNYVDDKHWKRVRIPCKSMVTRHMSFTFISLHIPFQLNNPLQKKRKEKK